MAAARLLLSEGTRVTAVDQAKTPTLERTGAELCRAGAQVVLGCRDLPKGMYDVCVVSPSVPDDSLWVRELKGRGVRVISELELGWSRCPCPVLAVTGSSGKSTLVKLCGEALAAAGRRVVMGGNYGHPISRLVCERVDVDWVVLEVSSFQLENIENFSPKVGVLLNIHPNHLDRHHTFEEYRRLKVRLFAKMDRRQTAVVPDIDAAAIKVLAGSRSRPCEASWVRFGLSADAEYRYINGQIEFTNGAGKNFVSFRGTWFDNEVMGLTAAAAVAAMKACGVDPAAVVKAAENFEPLPHRMQEVARKDGVRFVDDSKATTLSALQAGVIMAGDRVRLIAGGLLKEHDAGFLAETLSKKVRKVYLIGEASNKLAETWRGAVECVCCGTLEQAVKAAWEEAESGDVVLLSPGCASFDQFKNYEERGERFVAIVRELL